MSRRRFPTRTSSPRRVVRAVSVAVVLLFALPAAAGGVVRSATSRPPDFAGIYEFAGGNSSADAANPDLAGVVLVYYWRQLEPTKGHFKWSLVSRDMAPWVAQGKHVVLRVSTSGQPSWQPPYSAGATPGWVYRDGARSVRVDGSRVPVYWDAVYLTDYRAFVVAFGKRFDGNPHVAFVELGIGMGGETLPDTFADASTLPTWRRDGYNDGRWLATVKSVSMTYEAAFPQTPLYAMLDHAFLDNSDAYYGRLLSWYVNQRPHLGLQFNGLAAHTNLPAAWYATTVATEQRYSTATSGDCLCADLDRAIFTLHARYVLIYHSDIEKPSDRPYLDAAARLVQ